MNKEYCLYPGCISIVEDSPWCEKHDEKNRKFKTGFFLRNKQWKEEKDGIGPEFPSDDSEGTQGC